MTDQRLFTGTKLLPCPFCGSEAVDRREIDGFPMIYCSGDDCFGPQTTAKSFDDALVQWNTRAQPVNVAQAEREPEGHMFECPGCGIDCAALDVQHKPDCPRAFPGPAYTSRPRDFLAWAVQMFGPVAKLRSERLLRFAEEAIELAHAEGMERSTLNLLADRVYSRPPGNVGKEIGQAQACLETFAENIGLSSADEAEREWQRVQEIPREEWTRRHSAKQALGIALPSTPDGSAAEKLCDCFGDSGLQASTYSDGKRRCCDLCGLPVASMTSTEGK